MLLFELFFRKFGVRKEAQLLSPPLPALSLMELPKASVLHFISISPTMYGPPSDEFLFRNITHPIAMGHILELGDDKGAPHPVGVQATPFIAKYHLKNRRFKKMNSLQASTRDQNALVVFNYGMLSHLFKYSRSFYSDYYKWWNIEAAMWATAARVADETDRQQFVMCKLPQILPSITDLKVAAKGMNQREMHVFDTPEALTLLEIWKWIGPDRDTSLLNKVPQKHYARINLIFQESGHWFVLNLGVLDSWRKMSKEEKKDAKPEELKDDRGIAPEEFQKRFLRLMMSLFQTRTVAAPEITAAAGVPASPKEQPAESKPLSQPSPLPVITPTGTVVQPTVKVPLPDTSAGAGDLVAPNSTASDFKHDPKLMEQIDKDLEYLAVISQAAREAKANEPVILENEVPEDHSLENGVLRAAERLATDGMLSGAELRRYETLASAYKELPAPDGKGNLADFLKIPQESIAIESSPAIVDIATVPDKTMLHSSLHVFDSRYVREVMQKDIANMSLAVQRAGIAVTDYKVERRDSVLGATNMYSMRLVPVDGAASTVRFQLPVVDADGQYMTNGVKYSLRKQRGALPIQKIAPNVVALSSYYGKVFVQRSTKKVNDYTGWLGRQIMAKGLDKEDPNISNLHPANVFDNLFKAPRLFSSIAMNFRAFTLKPAQYPRMGPGGIAIDLNFDHTRRADLFGKEAMDKYEKDGAVIVGKYAKGGYMLIGSDNGFYVAIEGDSLLSDRLVFWGRLDSMLGLTQDESYDPPVDFVEVTVMTKEVPVGVVLGYQMGLERLMRKLGVTPRRVDAGTRVQLAVNEYKLVFSDETLVFNRDDQLAAMVLAGFTAYGKTLRNFSVYEFDRRDVYLNILEAGSGVRTLREIDLMWQMFIDPITRELLVEMKEPTDFRGLLFRCVDLLMTDYHPDELDARCMRIKGYERMAGAVYAELVRSIRSHNGRNGKTRTAIDLHPFAVLKRVAQDPAVALVVDINPIQNLKEQEAVTYSGVGGRNSRSMTKATRMYHRNDMGTISESTVDSSDVAINTYLSADPQFTSVRGISKDYVIGKTGATALLSTSALISPAADRDDPKRVNFIGIQHGHGIACDGYVQSPVRTGYEQVLAHRTGDLFALTAKKPGKVVSLDEHGMVVEYDDGEKKGITLGRRFGAASGVTIPHEVRAAVKAGQKFAPGALLCYNPGFFERDILNPNGVVWKAGALVNTVLLECPATLEDSCAISRRVAEQLQTRMTKVKDVVVEFAQTVNKLVKVGTLIKPEDILCIIEDAATAGTNLFDEETLDTLSMLGSQAPQAKTKGVVERVEIYYHGDYEDMSENLRSLAKASDRLMAQRHISAGKPGYTGSVDEGFRIDGNPLLPDHLCIRIYISADVSAGVGDKGVFGNQMKTVIGEVLEGEMKTESGEIVDAKFGMKSIDDRIVSSPIVIGTTNTLLEVIGNKMVEIYES